MYRTALGPDRPPNHIPERLATRLAALDEDARRILQVLSVICEPVNQMTLKRVLDVLQWRERSAVSLSAAMSKDMRHRLLADGLLHERRGTLSCDPDLSEPLTRACVADGSLAAIAAAAEQVLPAGNPWELETDARRLRLLRIALYTGRQDRVLDLLGLSADVPATAVPYTAVAMLDRVCLRPPDPAWLATLSPHLQALILAPTLREAALSLVPRPTTWRLMEDLLPPLAADHADAAASLAEQRILRGRTTEAAALLAMRELPSLATASPGRCVRLGEADYLVLSTTLVAKDTIEERILKLHATKRDLAEGLLAGTAAAGGLGLTEMIALVRESASAG